jgi:hypothetical protein
MFFLRTLKHYLHSNVRKKELVMLQHWVWSVGYHIMDRKKERWRDRNHKQRVMTQPQISIGALRIGLSEAMH